MTQTLSVVPLGRDQLYNTNVKLSLLHSNQNGQIFCVRVRVLNYEGIIFP